MSDYSKPEPLLLQIVGWLAAVAALAVIVYILVGCAPAHAAAVFQASDDKVRVVLFDEPCDLPAITNLPLRAEWIEGGNTLQGCWAQHPYGIVIAYWSDLTITLTPMRVFRRVISAAA